MKFEPVMKKFFDGLNEGKFYALKCPDCGHVEFPPYPACNECGRIGLDWIDVTDAEVTVNEIYSISPMMTIGDYIPFAPLFSCEATMEGGVEFACLIFGVSKKEYKELREQVPLKGKLVPLPMDGYTSFAVSINGAVPERKGAAGKMDTTHVLAMLGKDKKAAVQDELARDNGIDGTYTCVAKVMGQERACVLKLVVDGETAMGSFEMMDEVMVFSDGTFKDGNLKFSVPARGSEFVFDIIVGDGKVTGPFTWGEIGLELDGTRE